MTKVVELIVFDQEKIETKMNQANNSIEPLIEVEECLK